jgi:hypothetical protein
MVSRSSVYRHRGENTKGKVKTREVAAAAAAAAAAVARETK